MALYAIGDLHLSFGTNKPMDDFRGWDHYVDRLERNWRAVVEPEDTVVIAGDISWGMTLPEAAADFAFLQQLPGRKLLLKGNHDYWWTTRRKMDQFLLDGGFTSLRILHNDAVAIDNAVAVCGTRGWFLEEEQKPHDAKVLNRELLRLETSLKAAGDKPIYCFLHYPPMYQGYQCPEILALLEQYNVELCCYGHLHGPVIRRRMEGKYGKTVFSLISGDYLGFEPKKICDL